MNDRPNIDATGIFRPARQIPGWAEANREEAEYRNDAMLGLTDRICGLKIKPLTQRHLGWLDIFESPFLFDAPVEILLQIPGIELHVARFMWVLSPHFRPYNKLARRVYFWWYKRILYGKKTTAETIVTAIVKFMNDSLFDLKSETRGPRRKSYASGTSGLVYALCEKCGGLSPDPNAPNAAIDLPLNIIGQLLRQRLLFENPKARLSNRSEEKERAWLAELNASLKRN